MKIKKNSSIKATTWMGKYKDVKGNWKKVYFDVGSEDFDEVEELFEESISEPYTTMRLLGRAPSESLLKRMTSVLTTKHFSNRAYYFVSPREIEGFYFCITFYRY